MVRPGSASSAHIGRTAEARALPTAAHAWFAERRPAAREIVAARQVRAELRE